MQTFYSNIEALVYDEPETTLEDTTLPDVDRQDTKLRDYIEKITEAFGQETFGVKRTHPDGAADGGRAKTPRKEMNNEDIEQAIRNGRVRDLFYFQIEKWLKSDRDKLTFVELFFRIHWSPLQF